MAGLTALFPGPAAASRLFGRAGTWPAPAPQEAAIDPAAASLRYVLADADVQALPRCLVSLLGNAPDNAGDVLDSVLTACRARQEFPVVVMSTLDPLLVAVTPAPIELMPPRAYLRVLDDAEYERYLRRRWGLLLAKWGFAAEIQLALAFDEFVEHELSAFRA